MIKQFLHRLHSSAIRECVEEDLYWLGEGYVERTYRQMCYAKSINNDITIKCNRIDCQLWVNNDTPSFICIMEFYNSLGVKVMSLEFTELMAIRLLDQLCIFTDSTNPYVIIPIDIASVEIGESVCIRVDRLPNNTFQFSVYKYNVFYSNPNSMIPKITFFLSSEGLESELMYAMYFSWLIDIDNGDISLMESLYSKIIDQC